MFYHLGMLTSEAGRNLAAKLRRTARQRARRRPLPLAGEVEAVARLVQATAGKTGLLVREADQSQGRNENVLDEARCHQPSGLLTKAGADQELALVRRGEGPQSLPWEILTPMGSPSPGSDKDSGTAAISPDSLPASPDGVSAFIARVLDQLTLSAWLPAALFTMSIAVLLQFRSARSANILDAVRALTADPIRVLVLIIPLLVIATVVTQAFSFEAIRTLEGYWRRRGLAGIARSLMIRRHVRRKEAITRRRLKALEKAFYVAEPRMLRDGIPFPVVNALKAEALEIEQPSLTDEERAEFVDTEWQDWSDAWDFAKIDHLSNDKRGYPDTPRVLPTKLGNFMRATEDSLQNVDGDLQGFVLRRYAMVSRRVQMQHDQFRNRLEMYCTLVFVSAALLFLTPIILLGRGVVLPATIIISGSFAALSVASYLAALASAGGYCAALKQMDEEFQTPDKG